jgi:hypothetical protein
MLSSFFSGALGAIIGALATYFLQRRLETARTNEQDARKNIAEARFALELLNSMRNFARGVKPQYAQYEGQLERHMNVPALSIYIPNFPDKTFFLSLDFLGKQGHVKLLERLEFYRTRCHILTDIFRQRNTLYSEQVLPKLIGLFPVDPLTLRMTGQATPQQIIERIGIKTYSELKSLTDAIYSDLNYILNEFEALFKEANEVFIKLFPNR